MFYAARPEQGAEEMGEWIEISGDRAYRSSPESTSRGAVLLLHAWWGLNSTITGLADRLAGDGFNVLAPDLFEGVVLETIEAANSHVEEVEADYEVIFAKVQKVLDALLTDQGVPSVGVIGFSFGSAYGQWLARERVQVAAIVDFYGGLGFDQPERADGSKSAYLGHFAADDQYEDEDPAGVGPFHDRLQEGGGLSAAYLYPGTKHWFFEPDRPEHDPGAAQLAYDRTVEFLTRLLAV
jgi:carboxymethylenebutenolidase